MNTTQAAELRVKWKERRELAMCEHLNLELEWTDNGFRTGFYDCIVCGEHVVRQPRQTEGHVQER